MKKIIAVTGMPGAGKTLACEFAKERGYTVFYVGGLTKEELEKRGLEINEVNEREILNSNTMCTCITLFSLTFSTVNPRFLHDDLLLSKKSVYMKNAQERAGFKIFCRNA